MLTGIKVLCHSSIRIVKEKTIYIDPFKIDCEYNDADLIFCTHSHYDHFSIEDICKVRKDTTKIVVTSDCLEECLKNGFDEENVICVNPMEKYTIDGIEFETVPAYNIGKDFHPQEKNWVGYIIELNDINYYFAGDTDITPESKSVSCDVAFVPIGGIYTMNVDEAAELINLIEPQIAIPIHYGVICGDKNDGEMFKSKLKDGIECKILMGKI